MSRTRRGVDRAIFLLLGLGLVSPLAGSGQQAGRDLRLAPVPGGQLEYEVRGDGEAILFIHGSGIADSFLPIVAASALSGYQRIVLHRRGYAGSSSASDSFGVDQHAADAVALLRHLDAERAHVVGHSAGGIVAMEVAASYPDMVHS